MSDRASGLPMADGRHLPSLHTRFLLWFVMLLTATLTLFAGVLYLSVSRGLWGEFETRLASEVEAARSVLAPYWTADGITAPTYINPLPESDPRWVEVWSMGAERLFQSPRAEADPVPSLPPATGDQTWSVNGADGTPLRVRDVLTDIIGLPVVIRVMASEVPIRAQLRTILLLIGIGSLLCIGVAVVSCARLTRYALRPLEALVEQTAVVTAERLRTGVRIERADREVHAVAEAFNHTLQRLDVSFEQARRFSADASHELRTPLTSIRTVGQAALQTTRDGAQYREAIASMVEDSEHLGRLLDALLLLARADANQAAASLAPLDVGALVRDIGDECAVLAEERQHALVVEAPRAMADGDAHLLRLAIGNLLENAIRYTPPGGRIRVAVTQGPGQIAVAVEDSGPGIAPEHQAKVFERFYRVDRGRSRQAGGTGLGLSIAAWAATAHGGRITLDSRLGHGSTFRLEIPAADGPA